MKRLSVALCVVLFGVLAVQWQYRERAQAPSSTEVEIDEPNSQTRNPNPQDLTHSAFASGGTDSTLLSGGDPTTNPGPDVAQNEPQEKEPIPGSLEAWPFQAAKGIQTRDTKLPATDTFERVRTVHSDFKYPFLRVVEQWVQDPNGNQRITHRETMVANHILVKLQPTATEADLIRLNRDHGARILKRMLAPGMYLVELPSFGLDSVPNAVTAYNQAADKISYSEPDMVVFAAETFPNDANFSNLDGLHNTGQSGGTVDADIDAPEAWDLVTGGLTVVGVIDSGVEYTHEDLAANMWMNPGETAGDGIDNDGNGFVDDIYGWDFVNDDSDPMDDNSHGTHCSGTIAAVGNNGIGVAGVNWSGKIMALKFLSSGGSGPISDAIDCQAYANLMRTRGVNIRLTSNSWGGGGFSQGMADVIEAARSLDMLFIAAAGNSANNNDANPFYPATYPHDNVIAVAATDRNDNKASFSSYGLTTVDLGAPGVSTYSTVLNNSYGSKSGTSMATPHVAGAATLLWNFSPSESAQNVKEVLLLGTDPAASMAGITVSGGRLNAFNSLLSLGMRVRSTTPSPNEVVTAAPTQFAIKFTDAYDPTSIQATDLTVNTISADSVSLTTSDTVTFYFNTSPATSEGLHTLHMNEGSVTRLSDGDIIAAYTSTFRYDALPMEIISTLPEEGSTVILPVTSLRLNLNEPCDPASAATDDLLLSQGQVIGVNVINNDYTVEYMLSGIEVEGALTVNLKAGTLTDVHGNPGPPYEGLFHVDAIETAYPTPFVRIRPAGSLIYDPSASAFIKPSGDTDRYTFSLDGSQTVSVLVEPDATLQPAIELRGPSSILLGSSTADSAGTQGILQTVAAANPGTYTVTVGGAGNSTGGYSVRIFLNAALENEQHGGSSNDGLATAQPIDDSFIRLDDPGLQRAAVLGSIRSGSSTPLFIETFESGLLGPEWSTYSSATEGRIAVTGDYGAAAGSRALIMDRNPSGDYTLNEATYTIDLSGQNSASLSFWHASWYDEQHTFGGSFIDHANADGIAISDNGLTWAPLWSAVGTQPVAAWANYEFDLAAAAAAAGMRLNSEFRIRFQQYDNYPVNSDGRGWDEIVVSASSPAEDWYSFSLDADDRVSLVLADLNNGNLELELHSPGGLLAAGTSGAANVEKSIAGVHISQAGIYYARVIGSGEEDYSLVICRNARFDLEPNDSPQQAIDISEEGGALGALTCPPLLFALDWRYPPPSTIFQLDPATLDIVNQFQAPVVPHEHQSKHNLAFDGQHLWYNGGSNETGGVTIYKLDASDGAVVGSFTPMIPVPLGLAWMNGELFAADSTKTIHVFDDTTYALKRTLNPNTILAVAAFDADAKRNQLLGVTAQTLYRIDPSNGSILSTTPAPREGQERGLGVVCDEIFISEFGGRIAAFDAETGDFLRRMDAPYTQLVGGLAGLNTGGAQDWYSFQAQAGEAISLTTITPSGDPQQGMEFLNLLDPEIELYDPAMTLIASDQNSAADGKNTHLSVQAPQSGPYYVRVTGASSSKGEYVLSVDGNGSNPPNQLPQAAASAIPTSGQAPLMVIFDGSNSADADGTVVSYQWDFGDGASTSGVQTSHTYSAGTYTATLTVTDDDGASDSDSVIITVSAPPNQPPLVEAGVSISITLPANASLDGTVSDDGQPLPPGVTTTLWTKVSGPGTVSFDDPAIEDPAASFSSAGLYMLRLSAYDGELSSSDEVTITVNEPSNQPPQAIASAAPSSGEAPLAVAFDGSGSFDPDGTVVSYQWDFGDGTSASGIQTSHTYQAGFYIATLTVTDEDGDDGSETLNIVVSDPTWTITATAGANGSINPNGAVPVAHGTSQTFTISPYPNFKIRDVLVDGSSIGAADDYTFTNVTNHHTIDVSFESIYPVGDTAVSRASIYGTVTGSLADSATNDDLYEQITEETDGQTSHFEHRWTFNVYGAELVTFYVEAHHDANTEGDDAVFAYSTDQINWTDMLTVVKTSDDDTVQFYSLPSGLSGPVYIRATDLDRTPGNTALSSLYVDAIFIVSALPSTLPGPAADPNPAHTASEVSVLPTLIWRGGAQASSHDVYFGATPTLDGTDFQGNQLEPGFSPGALAPRTTYYWAISEVNSLGTTPGPIWSFTTELPPAQWVELEYEDFENNWGTWVKGGPDAKLSSTYAIGSKCLNLQDNSSSSYSELNSSLDLTGYTSIKIEFTFVASSFENNENFRVQFSHDGGASWSTIQTYVNDVDFMDNGTRYTPTIVLIPDGNIQFTSSVKIRIRCDASDDKDDVFIDNIRISGMFNPEPPQPAFDPSPANGAANVSQALQLDWSAGAGATSHDIYFGTSSPPGFAGTQTQTGFDPGPLDSGTTYYWSVDEKNAYGTAAGPVWSFTTGISGSWNELSYEDFESGWGSWVNGGADARLSSTYAIGSSCLNLQDDSSTSYSEMGASLDLTGYTSIKIEFTFIADSFENNEDFWVRLSNNNGLTWTTVKAFVNDVDFADDGTRYHPEIILDAASFPFTSSVKVRFECSASDNRDDVYIDNIRISAK